jgi:hypothetical protein
MAIMVVPGTPSKREKSQTFRLGFSRASLV